MHSPPGLDGKNVEPLNDFMKIPDTQEFGCFHCKFFQFSCKRKRDIAQWKGKLVANVDHRCDTWGVRSRGDSFLDENDYGRRILRFEKAPKKCDVLFVGEAPGSMEDENGLVFVGPSGKLLHQITHDDTRISENYQVRYTNVVRCWPWKMPNGSQKTPTIPEAKHCAGFLTDEIKKTKPKLIVPLGAIALKTIMGTNKASLKKMNGRLLKTKIHGRTVYVFPVYHPAYILRNDHLSADYIDQFEEIDGFLKQLKKTGKIKRKKASTDNYKICTNFKEAMRVIKRIRNEKKKVAYDIEAAVSFKRRNGDTSPNAYVRKGKIALIGLCNKPGEAYCIPYFHKEVPWSKTQRKKVRKALIALLQDPKVPKVAQNKKFDNSCFKSIWHVDIKGVDDTMACHYATDETQGTHSLDHLAYEMVPHLAGYKEAIEDAEKEYDYDFTRIPLDHGGIYNCKDVDVTLQVSNTLDKKLEKDPQLKRLAKSFLNRAIDALGVLEQNGVMIDLDAAEDLRAKYVKQRNRVEKSLRVLPEVQRYQAARYRAIIKKRKHGDDAPKTYKARMGRLPKTISEKVKVNFNSTQQVRKILYKYLGYPIEEAKKTNTFEASTDKEMLIKFASEKKCRFSQMLMEFRLLDKIVGTYIDSIVHDVMQMKDGLLHGSYSLTTTVTGRSSSKNPNLQNIPNKGNGDVKRMFVSRFKSAYDKKVISLLTQAVSGQKPWDDVIEDLHDVGCILDYDYSQIELRILAIFSQDPTLLRIYREGGDVHLETTLAIFDMTREDWDKLDKGEKKRRRTIAKRTNFGTVYGSGAQGICDMLAKENPPIYIDEDEAQKFIDRFFAKYKGARRWIDAVLRKLHKNGELRTKLGRLRRLPEVDSVQTSNQNRAERQGPNALIQSAASDVTITALVILVELLDELFAEQGLESKIILTVHDSLVFDVKFGELQQVAELIEEVMSNVPKYGGIIWGDEYDWDWLESVPIITEGEVGPNYRDKYEFGHLDPDDPFKIHKAFATALLGDGQPPEVENRFVGSLEKDAATKEAAYGKTS